MAAIKAKAQPALGPRVEQLREILTAILEAQLHHQPPPVSPGTAAVLCHTLGVWPMPPDEETRLSALQLVGARLLPMLNGHPPQHDIDGQEEHWRHNLARWCECVEADDGGCARAGAVLLGLWRRADARGHRVH